jgi:hypothetical protein
MTLLARDKWSMFLFATLRTGVIQSLQALHDCTRTSARWRVMLDKTKTSQQSFLFSLISVRLRR